MATLEDFADKAPATLDDYAPEKEEVKVLNKKTTSQLAAQGAYITQNPDDFATIQSELDTDEASPTLDGIMQRVNQESRHTVDGVISDYLGDLSVPSEERERKAMEFREGVYNPAAAETVKSAIYQEGLTSDEDLLGITKSSPESEFVRVNVGNAVNELIDSKIQIQALQNRHAATGNADLAYALGDLIETILPFSEGVQIGRLLAATEDEEASYIDKLKSTLKGITARGDAREELRNRFLAIPPDERVEWTRKFLKALQETSTTLVGNDNDFIELINLRTVLEDGFYTDISKSLDNLVSFFDAMILGNALVSGAGRAGSRAGRGRAADEGIEGEFMAGGPRGPTGGPAGPSRGRTFEGEFDEMMGDIALDRLISGRQASSLADSVAETNAAHARTLHSSVVNSSGDDLAEAVYGTTRAEAIASDVLPQLEHTSLPIARRVHNIGLIDEMGLSADIGVVNRALHGGGGNHYWKEERLQMENDLKAGFSSVHLDMDNVVGIRTLTEVSTIGALEGDTIRVGAMYGPSNGEFATAQDALDQVQFALRKYGVTDADTTLMMRTPDGYVPVTPETDLSSGMGFLTKVDYTYNFNPKDITDFHGFDIRANYIASIPGTFSDARGSLLSYLTDRASIFHPKTVGSATAAVNRTAFVEAELIELLKKFTDPAKKLSSERYNKLESFFRRVAASGENPNRGQLRAEGFDDVELDIIARWKDITDTNWVLSNADMVRTSKNRGEKMVTTSDGSTQIVGKPIKQPLRSATAFDIETGQIRAFGRRELDELYEAGGSLVQIKSPITVGDDATVLVTAGNSPATSYIREISPNDALLGYKPYYSPVTYKAGTKFVVMRTKNASGEVIHEGAAVAAGTTKEAELAARRMAAISGKRYDPDDIAGSDIFVRDDKRFMEVGSEDFWNLNSHSGMMNQKVRGGLLNRSTSMQMNGAEEAFVESPIDAMIKQVISLSERVGMRDYLQTFEARMLNEFGFVFPKNADGSPRLPVSQSEIQSAGFASTKMVRDARTALEYYNYLQSGYQNAIDNVTKGAINGLSKFLGKIGAPGELATAELAEKLAPAALSKNLASTLYISLSPQRQALLQAHQSILLLPNHAGYVSTNMIPDLANMLELLVGVSPKLVAKTSTRSKEELLWMLGEFKESGLLSGINKQNLVRGSITDLSDRATLSTSKGAVAKAGNLVGKGVSLSRQVGFSSGETINKLTSFLAHRNQFIQQNNGGVNRPLTPSERDFVAGKAENYTFNMNRAGDQPYNHNEISMIMQYLQFGHKSMMTPFNRGLTPKERVRMVGYEAILFGLPLPAMYTFLGEILPEDPQRAEEMALGLWGIMLNETLSRMSGDNVRLDWSNIAPVDHHSMFEFIHNVATGDIGEILANSPAGAIFAGENAPAAKAFRSLAKVFNFSDEGNTPEESLQFIQDALSMSSGMSAYFRYRLEMRSHMLMSSNNNITDTSANKTEIVMGLFGIPTIDESKRRALSSTVYLDGKEFEEDIQKIYNIVKVELGKEGLHPGQLEYTVNVISQLNEIKELDNLRAQKEVARLIAKDAKDGDDRLMRGVAEIIPFMKPDQQKKLLNMFPEEMKEQREAIQVMLDGIHDRSAEEGQ